jgi:hypothetical protein
MPTFQHKNICQFSGSFIRHEVFAAMIIQILYFGLYYCVTVFQSTCCRKQNSQSLVY